MVKKTIIGILIVILLVASIAIVLPDKVRIDIGKTNTKYSVMEDEKWVLAATEYVNLFDGSKKMRAKSRELIYWNDSNFVYIQRISIWKDEIKTIQTYKFDIYDEKVDQFPMENRFECFNCEGKIVHYEIRDILYKGLTKIIKSPFSFEHNMKIEWQDGAYFHKVYKQKTVSDKIIIKYRPQSDYEEYKVRLFDPPIEGNNLIIANGESVTLGGDNDTYDTVWIQSGGTLNINTIDKYLNLIANNITIDGTINAINMYDGGVSKSCSSSSAEVSGSSGSGLTPGGGGPADDSDFFNHGLGGGGAGNARPYTQYYTSSCDGYNYYIGQGGGYCGAFDSWRDGGGAGNVAASTQTDFNITAGSGGGSGGCYNYANTGVGGKGAGYIILSAPIVNIQGTVNLKGSNGGSGSCTSTGAYGGGGAGSGGSLVIFGNAVDISGSTIDVSPGSGGAGGTCSGARGTGGGAGSGGRIKIFYETFDNTSASTTLGAFGTYYSEEIPLPVSGFVSDDRNLTTEVINASCNNTMNNYGTANYTWTIYNNSVILENGTTNAVAGYISIANYSADYFSHNDTIKVECTLNYGEQNLTDRLETVMHQPIWIDITSPLDGSSSGSAQITINFDYENYTAYSSCWYNNGTTNISNDCDGLISPILYEDGEHTITIYSNTSSYLSDNYMTYQEFANQTSQPGSYYGGSPASNIVDGDWGTRGACSAGTCYTYENYTKVDNVANSTTWRIKMDGFDSNVTLPDSCFDYDASKIILRFIQPFHVGDATYTDTHAQCYDGTWNTLASGSTWGGIGIYEDAIYWNITIPYETSDSVTFTVAEGNPDISFISPTEDNGTWVSQDFIYAKVDIPQCLTYKNVTYNIWSFNISNITSFNTDCLDNNINWTSLPDGEYKYNVTVWNIYDKTNTTETRTIYLDTTYPLISYTANSDPTNITANFSVQDWIFVNTSVTELHEESILFTLWNATQIINYTTYTDETHFINWTSLPESMYFYNAYVCDYAGKCNTTETRNYGVETTILSIDSDFINISVELGGDLQINASNNLGTICIDIDHPEYGINYSCSTYQTGFELLIDYFRKNIFNDSTISKLLEYIGTQIKTIYFPAHQWDEVDDMSINISGVGLPENVQINKSNTAEVDRIFPGFLIGSNIYLNKTIDNIGNQSLFFQNPGSKNINFFMDDNANFISFIFNITGLEFGFEYEDDFDNFSNIDTSLTNANLDSSGSILFANSSLKEFIFDDFEDASVDTSLWDKSDDWSSSGNPSKGFAVTETSGYIRMYHYWQTGGGYNYDSGLVGINTNIEKMTLRDSENIQLRLTNNYDSSADNEACNGYSILYLGNTNVWQSKVRQANYDGFNQVETNVADVTFNMTKLSNGQWNVKITGTETAYGNGIRCDEPDESAVTDTYDWTNGSYTTYFHDRTCADEDTSGTMPNDFNISVDYNGVAVKVVNIIQATRGGCDDNTIDTRIYYINNSLYYRDNGTVISESIYDSSGPIIEATLTAESLSFVSNDDTFTYYLSADGGINWENVASGVKHIFSEAGSIIKWRVDFNTTSPGYKNSSNWLESIFVNTTRSFPINISFDFGNDGIIDATFDGELNSSNSPYEVSITTANLTSALNENPILYDHLISVPLKITSDSVGQIDLEFFNLTYNPNPIKLNISAIWNFLINSINFINFPISIESIGGNITVDDIRYDYAGGNKTYEILAHNDDYSINNSLNITYYYSRWDYNWIPSGVEWIYFAPITPTDQDVAAYGQNSLIPLMNITNYGYGGKNANLSVYMNETLSCVNTTISLTNSKSDGVQLNESWINLAEMSYLETVNISMWADYNCNYSNWNVFDPYIIFRQCVENGTCSEEII